MQADLNGFREAIDKYYSDSGKYPDTLDESGYQKISQEYSSGSHYGKQPDLVSRRAGRHGTGQDFQHQKRRVGQCHGWRPYAEW